MLPIHQPVVNVILIFIAIGGYPIWCECAGRKITTKSRNVPVGGVHSYTRL